MAQGHVVEVNVTVGRRGPPMSEQASRNMQAFTAHDRVRGVRMAKVMQPCVRHDPSSVARRVPEIVEFVRSQ